MKEKLKQYMKETGLTQKQLATLLGISHFTINRWLSGDQNISKIYAEHIARKLKLKVDNEQ